jgi:hypothetical protein
MVKKNLDFETTRVEETSVQKPRFTASVGREQTTRYMAFGPFTNQRDRGSAMRRYDVRYAAFSHSGREKLSSIESVYNHTLLVLNAALQTCIRKQFPVGC